MFLDVRLPVRFWAKCIPEPNTGCWIWIGSLDTAGYGSIWNGERVMGAHRFAYERLIGEVPRGLVLDHVVCDLPCCVNPAHLRPATNIANVMRGTGAPAFNARKTHCKNGHPLVPGNLYIRPNSQRRECCACSGRNATAG